MLLGGFKTLKNMSQLVWWNSPWKNKTCSKPPNSIPSVGQCEYHRGPIWMKRTLPRFTGSLSWGTQRCLKVQHTAIQPRTCYFDRLRKIDDELWGTNSYNCWKPPGVSWETNAFRFRCSRFKNILHCNSAEGMVHHLTRRFWLRESFARGP